MIEGIPPEYKSDAVRLLQFIAHAIYPLSISEAIEVIATRMEQKPPRFHVGNRLLDEASVLRYCPSLISISAVGSQSSRTEKKVHLAHFSVKEYLLRTDNFNPETSNISIAKTCLAYLVDIKTSNDSDDFPLMKYATYYWTDHVASVKSSADIRQAAIEFLHCNEAFARWAASYDINVRNMDKARFPEAARLYYICQGGLIEVARALIENGADVNAKWRDGNALHAASINGHQEIVQLLLNEGANIDASGERYGTALQAASYVGFQEIVQLLLNEGANIDASGGRYGTALQAASLKGKKEIVKLLLNEGANIDASGERYGTALQAASYVGFQEIVQLLLNEGANIDASEGWYGTALQAASMNGKKEIVKLLLNEGANIDASGGRYGTALQAASMNGEEEIVQLLLNEGANIDDLRGKYGTARRTASIRQESRQLLWAKEAAYENPIAARYSTALQAAYNKGLSQCPP
jgi:ankyrin repeat protein